MMRREISRVDTALQEVVVSPSPGGDERSIIRGGTGVPREGFRKILLRPKGERSYL
jgi:hypothetical protein